MIILLITHITIALSSIAIASLGYIRPSHRTLHISYVSIAATLISGTVLIIASQSGMLRSCLTGIAYTAGVTYVSILTRHKLAASTER